MLFSLREPGSASLWFLSLDILVRIWKIFGSYLEGGDSGGILGGGSVTIVWLPQCFGRGMQEEEYSSCNDYLNSLP